MSPPCTPGAISVPYDTGPLCCALESPGELLKVQMSRTGSISVKSEPEVGVRGQHKHQEFFFFFFFLNFPRDSNMQSKTENQNSRSSFSNLLDYKNCPGPI